MDYTPTLNERGRCFPEEQGLSNILRYSTFNTTNPNIHIKNKEKESLYVHLLNCSKKNNDDNITLNVRVTGLLSKITVDKSTIEKNSHLPNNEKIRDSTGDINVKVIDKNIPHNGLWSPRGMAISILSFWIVLNIIIVSGFELKLYNYASLSAGDMTSIILVNASMVVFTVYATVNTRTSIMERYQIPVGKLGGRIETMQSALFFPLTIAQMRRHTTSDDDNGGACCADARVTERQGP